MKCKQGDIAMIIGGALEGSNANVGKMVRVGVLMGDHSKYGQIWHVHALGQDLVTEYGATGRECDCADEWLDPLPPDALPATNDKLFEPNLIQETV